MCALWERERSGKGQVVDAAMVDGSANLFAFFAAAVHSGLWGRQGTNMLDTAAHFYEVYETSDGGFMSVGAIEPQFYAELLAGLEVDPEDLPHQMDVSQWPDLKKRFAEIFRSRTRDEWTAVFEKRDACVFPVLTPHEAPKHRYNTERDTHVQGPFDIMQPAAAPRLSRTPGSVTTPAPEPGKHSRDVLRTAGYSDEEIDALGQSGAAAWPAS